MILLAYSLMLFSNTFSTLYGRVGHGLGWVGLGWVGSDSFNFQRVGLDEDLTA